MANPVQPADATWRGLYRLGGVSALVFVVLVLVPVVLVFAAPVPPAEGRAVLEYIAEYRVVYLVELICFVGLSVPALLVFVALAAALWRVDRGIALVGGALGVTSEAVALSVGSNPQSLHGGLVVLSDSYQAAATGAERDALVSAAEALIAVANAMPWAGILTAAAILVLSLLLRRGGFGRALAVVGVATGALGIVSEALRPIIGSGYLLYGMLLPLWFGWVGWRLWRLGSVVLPSR